jgi:Tfp pilus assembly major pilin PilA
MRGGLRISKGEQQVPFGDDKQERQEQRQRQIQGFFASLRMTKKTTATATAKTTATATAKTTATAAVGPLRG